MHRFQFQEKNNFDLLRLSLAIGVIIFHIGVLTRDDVFMSLSSIVSGKLMVDGFFILSGFFIFMSYERSKSFKQYIIKRLRRIYPAYLFVVIVTSILLIFVSTSSFHHYFSIDYIKYLFYNIIFLNYLAPKLPGVFENNFISSVNGALWTLKIEVMFYLFVPIFVWLFNKTKRIYVIGILYLLSFFYTAGIEYYIEVTGNQSYQFLLHQFPAQVMFFMTGALFYYYYNFLEKYKYFLIMLGAFLFFLVIFYNIMILYPIMLGIIVMSIGLFFYYFGEVGRYGDFSYGMYLVHFPIIQTFIAIGFFSYNKYLAFISVLILSLLLAYFIWNYIEKPFMYKKSHYVHPSA